VEHTGHLEIVQKLQDLDQCTDAELEQIIAYAEEVARHGRA